MKHIEKNNTQPKIDTTHATKENQEASGKATQNSSESTTHKGGDAAELTAL